MRWIALTGMLLTAGLCASVALASDAFARARHRGAEQRLAATPAAHGPGGGSSSKAMSMSGIASIYGGSKYGSRRTASGEQQGTLTAAHRNLPFGTMVQVTNRRNGRSVVVRINDRGPFIRGRVIDVTPAAARALGFSGLTAVSLAVVGRK